jgi:hypothetical protein
VTALTALPNAHVITQNAGNRVLWIGGQFMMRHGYRPGLGDEKQSVCACGGGVGWVRVGVRVKEKPDLNVTWDATGI